jgi:cobalt-zinc-cadmium efflux system outer membrane protein
MRSTVWHWWVLASALGAATAPAQQADTIINDTLRVTRGQAVAQALAHNPQLEVAREQTAEAQAQRRIDGAIPDPTGSAQIFQQKGQPIGRPLSASIDVPFPDKFRLNYNIGTAGVKAAESNYAALRQQIASQTAQTYDSLRTALRHRDDLTESRGLSADFLKRTQARFDAGTVAKLDVIRAQVDVASSDNALISNARDVTNARSSLNRLIGRRLALPITPSDTLGVPLPLPPLEPIEQYAIDHRPELAGLAAQQAGAKATTHLAEEFWLPDIIGGVTTDAGAPDFAYPSRYPIWNYGLSVPIPIFFWQHTGGDIALSRHHERELAASYRDTRAMVDQDVRAAYAAAVTALQQALFIRDQFLPSARAAYRVASASYALGGSSALDVLGARRDLVSAESQYTDALAAANAAQADLERAAASPLDPFRAGDQHDH